MSILGIHHITLVTADAQKTIDFYTCILGLKLVKKTVNFDNPGSYHLYFGDETGKPGTVITFFEWRGAERGYPGIGGSHHFALQVPNDDVLLKWKRRLVDAGIPVNGPLDRHYFHSIYFNDPDGSILELATVGPGWAVDEEPDQIGSEFRDPPAGMMVANRDEARIRASTWPEPILKITPDMELVSGLHHITAIGTDIQRTHDFYSGVLGMQRVKMTSNFDDPGSAHWYWGASGGQPGTLITYFERKAGRERRMRMGAGQTHHFALAVADETVLGEEREKLLSSGLRVSPVIDRYYFKSIYFNDPDGQIVELATVEPGFLVDEKCAELGRRLQLPVWLEPERNAIESILHPVEADADSQS